MIKFIENQVSKDTNLLLNHEFFINLNNGIYKKEKLNIFSEQYYILSLNFTDLLFLSCLRIRPEEMRLPIVKNIWDEYGHGYINNSHRSLLERFVVATGSNTKDIVPLKSTKRYITNMSNLYNKWSEVEILSALGVGCEALTTKQYKILTDSLINTYNFDENELMFFTDHINHDPLHTFEIYSVLENYLNTDENIEQAITAAKEAIFNEKKFWDGIHRAVKN